jgi:hypothetical protein
MSRNPFCSNSRTSSLNLNVSSNPTRIVTKDGGERKDAQAVAFQSSMVQRQTGTSTFREFPKLASEQHKQMLLFWIWDTRLAANLACEEVGDSICLGTVVMRRGSARLTYLLCFDPSSASAHPKRSKCRMSSRRFTYTSSCSITILFLGSLDRSTGWRIIRTASMRFSRASSNVAPCVNAPGTSSVHATHHFPS